MRGLLRRKIAMPVSGSGPKAALILLAACLGWAAAPALAQGDACQAIRSELASLERNPNARQAARARAEVQQLTSYMASIGCNQRQFLIFGAPPPPQCGPLSARLQRAQQALAASGANPYATQQRRNQLQAALQSYGCLGAQPQQRGLFESLFGGSGPETLEVTPDGDMRGGGDIAAPRGGSKPVCVRTCDGYYFPLDISTGRARAQGDQLCQALCPEAKTGVYFMAPGGEIEGAVSNSGQNYTALPSALQYRKSVSPDCACKAPTESWAALLKPAEQLLNDTRRGDAVVTPEQSQMMSRPAPPKAGKQVAIPTDPDLDDDSAPDDDDAATGRSRVRVISPTLRR
jgi:hypothetical protein